MNLTGPMICLKCKSVLVYDKQEQLCFVTKTKYKIAKCINCNFKRVDIFTISGNFLTDLTSTTHEV